MEELTTSKADLEAKVAELGNALEESEAQVLRLNELLQPTPIPTVTPAVTPAASPAGR